MDKGCDVMNELNVFQNPEFGSIRTTMIDDEPWFVGKDVASALAYKNSNKAIKDHVDEEDKGVTSRYPTPNNQPMTIINESGLYSLILSSKLPNARKFKRWVTSEVLPAIRKTGSYVMSQRNLTKDDYLKAALIVSRCKNERLPYVLNFLESAGFCVPKIEKESIVINRTYMDDSVVGFLDCYDDVEIENIPTRIVYSQYADYCDKNNLVPLCSGEFSKQVKRICNVSIISKTIKGKSYRIFIKN